LLSLQKQFDGIQILIFDEFSMIGPIMLHHIHERCQQITGNTNEKFGGLIVLFFGDPFQLTPVLEKSLPISIMKYIVYNDSNGIINKYFPKYRGCELFTQFKKMELVTQNRYDKDMKLKEILTSFRDINNTNINPIDDNIITFFNDHILKKKILTKILHG
jgi:hypothetical protein